LQDELETDIKRTARDLQRAIETEDYKAASLLKQHLQQLELEVLNSDPVLFLQKQLENAVSEERYEVLGGVLRAQLLASWPVKEDWIPSASKL